MILAGVFFVATGRGGELAYEHADHAPLDLGPVSATDVALLRPPTALWGYNMQVTDEALDRIARALRDRDIEIASLQRQLADLSHGQAGRAHEEAWYTEAAEPPHAGHGGAGQLGERDKPDERDQPDERDELSGRDEADERDEPGVPGEPGEPDGHNGGHSGGHSGHSKAGDCDGDTVAAAEEQGW